MAMRISRFRNEFRRSYHVGNACGVCSVDLACEIAGGVRPSSVARDFVLIGGVWEAKFQ